MKQVILTLVIMTLFCKAFTQKLIPRPEFSDLVYFWNETENTLLALSKENPQLIGGHNASYVFSGLNSSTELQKNGELSFIVNSTNPMMISSAKLYKMEINNKNKNRSVVIALARFGKADLNAENSIEYNVKKVEDGSIMIVPSESLNSGEYVFIAGGHYFTFTVE